MASGNYIKYAREVEYEPQSFYFASGSSYEVCGELRRLGAKRILFICNKTVSKYKNYTDLSASFENNKFRSFEYVRPDGQLKSSDIVNGLRIYKEFNCDTIITVGGKDEIDCGKMISAMYTNDVSNPSDLVGLDKIKKDISLLCCIVTDNSCAASVSFAEFFDENNSKWDIALSAFLIPQVVVIDTDIAMRTDKKIAFDCALTALGVAIESYISPVASAYPDYRANSIDSFKTLNKYIDLMMEDPDESYYRRRVAVAGLAAGVSSRITGLGLAHILVHSIISRKGETSSYIYLKVLLNLLYEAEPEVICRIAEFSRLSGVVKENCSDKAAVDIFIKELTKFYSYFSEEEIPVFERKETSAIVTEVFKEADLFGLDTKMKVAVEHLLKENR